MKEVKFAIEIRVNIAKNCFKEAEIRSRVSFLLGKNSIRQRCDEVQAELCPSESGGGNDTYFPVLSQYAISSALIRRLGTRSEIQGVYLATIQRKLLQIKIKNKNYKKTHSNFSE